jgi:1-acyl-sn-glycerol-3-phosphate acyltransferase
VARVRDGRSVVVFPQTTRTVVFDPVTFNTIGVKMARRAGVPLVPLALKTDAWANGRRLKDWGRIDPRKPVHFCFGRPLQVSGAGRAEHEQVVRFIQDKLRTWQDQDAPRG